MRVNHPAFRPVLCVVLAASAGGAGLAHAATKPAPKPVCNLLTDAAGDADGTFLQEGMLPSSEDAVDIVSGDVAADTKFLTTVLRVKKLAASSATAPGGLHWKFFVTVGGSTIYTQVIAPVGGSPSFGYGHIDPTAGTSSRDGDAQGVLDLAKNEVRVSIPAGSLPVKLKTGTRIDTLEPNAGRYYGSPTGSPSLSDSTDLATSSKVFKVGQLSCVKPGK
jgi:hypothetical protein